MDLFFILVIQLFFSVWEAWNLGFLWRLMFTVNFKDSDSVYWPSTKWPCRCQWRPLFSPLISLCHVNRKLQTTAAPPPFFFWPPYFPSEAVDSNFFPLHTPVLICWKQTGLISTNLCQIWPAPFVPLQQPHQVTLQPLLSVQLKSLVPSEQITSVLHLLAAMTEQTLPACLLPSAVMDTKGGHVP